MRDKLICLFSSLNILLFSFLLINVQALSTIQAYEQQPQKGYQALDQTLLQVQRQLLRQRQDHTAIADDETPTLFIPKLNIITSISSATAENNPSKLLTQGTLSLTPYSPEHQTIVFGHSSDYVWNDNPFGTIFTLLPELDPGDIIKVFHQRQSWTYRITETLITEPDLEPLVDHEGPRLILSTCYPIGFWSQRYNVIAEPITHSL